MRRLSTTAALAAAAAPRKTTVASFISQTSPDANEATAYTIQGWVRSVRVHKHVSFLSLFDGSTPEVVQVVVPSEEVKSLLPQGLNTGASVICTGTQSLSRQGKIDMTSQHLQLVGGAVNMPVQKKEHTASFLRDEALQFRHRTEYMHAVLRMRSALGNSLRNALEEDGFEWISTPILTTNDCEGAGELFQLRANKILPHDTFLTVSGQLHSEIFVTGAFQKVYTFGPTFRAEHSQTTRHLSEFWMCEPEMAFCTGMEAALQCERVLKRTVSVALERREKEMAVLRAHHHQNDHVNADWLKNEFAHLTYAQARQVLQRDASELPTPADGLSTAQERFLVEKYCQNTPVFVSAFPAHCKPFYCLRDEQTGLADNFDLLVPGIGELVGGSAREHRYDVLKQRMTELNLLPQLDWYLDLRKYGSTPHAGFGIGFERLIQFVTGVENIRDVSPIPRFPGIVKF